MWLSDIIIEFKKINPKPLAVEVAIGCLPTLKIEFKEGERVYSHQLVPTALLGSDTTVSIKLMQRTTLWPKIQTMVKGIFEKAAVNREYCDGRGCKITLNVVAEPKPLEDLIIACHGFAQELRSVLDRLGRTKDATATTLTVATAIGELNSVGRAVVGLVVAVHKHLQDQEKQDRRVKELTHCIREIFSHAERAKGVTISAKGVFALVSEGEPLFRECVQFVLDYCSIPAAARALRAVMTSKHKDKLDDLERDLRAFESNLKFELLLHISEHISTPSYVAAPVSISSILPPKPIRLLGRQTEIETVNNALLKPSPRVVLLGDGGMGKTSLALWVLHDENVRRRFKSQIFIACEGAISTLMLIAKIADALQLPREARDSKLYPTVLIALARQKYLLCLDNFETVWEGTERRVEVEELLRHLHSISSLGLIITMRGTERPVPGLPWTRMPPLAPLPCEAAVTVFEDITGGSADRSARTLIDEVACIPLAITLVATLARDQSTDELLQSWFTRGTSIVQTSGTDRGSNLDTSILLSVNSARVQKHPITVHILALIASLPNGLSRTVSTYIVQHNPDVNIYKALDTLKHVALVSTTKSSNGGSSISVNDCHDVLPPIRRWCTDNLTLPEQLKHALYHAFIELLVDRRDRKSDDTACIVRRELPNAEVTLLHAFDGKFQDSRMYDAAISHSRWSEWTGYISGKLIRRATIEFDGAQKAACLQRLGGYSLWRDELDQAEAALKSALKLHKQARDISGQANDLHKLANVFMRRDSIHVDALLQSAFQLYRQANDILGQADVLQDLGRVCKRRGRDEGKLTLEHALRMHRQIQSVEGEATDLQLLGELALRRGDFQGADTALKAALALHEQVQDVCGQARDLRYYGFLKRRQNEFDQAETAIKRAVELHQQAQSASGQAIDLGVLGETYLARKDLDKALSTIQAALILHTQVQDFNGQANDLGHMADVLMQQNKLEEAEKSVNTAIELHKRDQNALGLANDLLVLGKLHARLDRLVEAETTLNSALKLYRQAQCVHHQADSLLALGQVYVQKNSLDEAESCFNIGLELYQRISDMIGQGFSRCGLGDVFVRRIRLDEAHAALTSALDLFKGMKYLRGKAHTLHYLALLNIQRADWMAAKCSIECALELHRTFPDKESEGADMRVFAQIFTDTGDLDQAYEALQAALRIHRQINSPYHEKLDLEVAAALEARRIAVA